MQARMTIHIEKQPYTFRCVDVLTTTLDSQLREMQLTSELSGQLPGVKSAPCDALWSPEETQDQLQHCDEPATKPGTLGPTDRRCRVKEEPPDNSSTDEHPIVELETEPYNTAILSGLDEVGHVRESTSEEAAASTSVVQTKNEPKDICDPAPLGCYPSNAESDVNMTSSQPPLFENAISAIVNGRHGDSRPGDVASDEAEARDETCKHGVCSAARVDSGHSDVRTKTNGVKTLTEGSEQCPAGSYGRTRETRPANDPRPTALPPSESARSHNKPPGNKKLYQCDVCLSPFSNRAYLRTHRRTHTGERPYKCDACSAAFSQRSNLQSHKRTHTGEKPYKCDVCPAQFRHNPNLQRHKRAHTGEKPYKCDVCPAEFSQGTNLQRHRRTHTGEKPYRCDVCPAEYAHGHELKAHARAHTGERPYECDLCPARFRKGTLLWRHKRAHTGERPYACDLCPAEFGQSTTLRRHKQTHAGKKQYQCGVCPAEFVHREALKVHTRTHTGEKPYECDLCVARFSRSATLRRHKTTHAGEEP
ncbi:zinc finger protein 239-like isoform X2 [Ornithodoros turicata]